MAYILAVREIRKESKIDIDNIIKRYIINTRSKYGSTN
jgi:hypothetical protein